MFDIGIWEIGVIGVVALVVLGPERLPKVARTAGHMFGRLQRYVANVKADINREIELDELKKLRTTVTEAAQSIESSVKETVSGFESQAAELNSLANGTAMPATEATPTAAQAPALSPEASAAADEAIRQALASSEMPVPEAMPVYAPPPEVPAVTASAASPVAEAAPLPGAKA